MSLKDVLLKAAKMVEDQCDAIDLNLGVFLLHAFRYCHKHLAHTCTHAYVVKNDHETSSPSDYIACPVTSMRAFYEEYKHLCLTRDRLIHHLGCPQRSAHSVATPFITTHADD